MCGTQVSVSIGFTPGVVGRNACYCPGGSRRQHSFLAGSAGVLGGKVVAPESPCIIKLANSWIILNSGGGPTPDKPDVTLEPPETSARVNSFLNLRVADIQACYVQWTSKGAVFITEPLDNHGWETRCYMRDPDGYIIEVGQASQRMIDLFRRHEGEAETKTKSA